MKIAILGSGAAGSVFAAFLKRGGADDITLIDMYKAHMDAIAENGLTMTTPQLGTFTQSGFKTAYTADGLPVMDILIIMVKANQTETALSGASSCIGENTVVVTLQNGLGNEIAIQKFVSSDRIIMGCGNMGTELPEPGHCIGRPHEGTNMFFGPVEKSELTEKVGRFLEECFRSGGLCPLFTDEIRTYIWQKATSNSGNNTVCAITRLKIKETNADPYAFALTVGIWKEAAAVAEAMGIHGIWEYMEADAPKVVASFGDYYPSMAQDMLIHHRQTEVDSLTGAIAYYGKQVGVPTPYCDVLTLVVKAIQGNYDKQYLG